MNTKRQTIWLVSMLSLMVVLSAYYLFSSGTEDLDNLTKTTQEVTEQTKVNITEDGTIVQTPVDPILGTDTKDPNSKATSGQTDGVKSTDVMTEDEIIKKATEKATSGTDFFFQQEMERHDMITKEVEKWTTISADKDQSKEAVGEALEKLRIIDETNAKIEQIEETLGRDYPNALVQQSEDGRWKVTVQAAALEKKQAVAIIDLVMKEMNIGADKFAGVQIKQ
jgi:stage III sporulation protein AH